MAAPAGAVVRITYDSETPVVAGDWLRTGTGRGYHVLESLPVQRGPRAGTRFRLRALVCDEVPHGAPPNARVHALHWYKRSRAR